MVIYLTTNIRQGHDNTTIVEYGSMAYLGGTQGGNCPGMPNVDSHSGVLDVSILKFFVYLIN